MNTDYRHLKVDERVFIQLALERGCTWRAIASSVQRAPSTISRELARNAWIRPPKQRGRGRPRLAGGYRAVPAQKRAVLLAQTPSGIAAPGVALHVNLDKTAELSRETFTA
jgi:IS30 family transposase